MALSSGGAASGAPTGCCAHAAGLQAAGVALPNWVGEVQPCVLQRSRDVLSLRLDAALDPLTGGSTSLITLYYGADATDEQAQATADHLRQRYAGHEVEVATGGQPHYVYIVSLE